MSKERSKTRGLVAASVPTAVKLQRKKEQCKNDTRPKTDDS